MHEHITEKLSAYLNHELPPPERQAIAEHLLNCQNCRSEHDEIKFGAALAGNLRRSDAPENLLNEIKTALDERKQSRFSFVPNFAFSGGRSLATAMILLVGLASAFYFGFRRTDTPEIVKIEPPVKNVKIESASISPTPVESVPNQNTNAQISSGSSNVQLQSSNSTDANPPKFNSPRPKNNQSETIVAPNNPSFWNVETLAGTPRAGNQTIAESGKLSVGQFLETDADSKAKIQVADIGQVEIAPNSRVRLVKTSLSEHRLSLERGVLQAKILAPPRLFIVDTPSAVAVDLGCEYTLEVDAGGNSRLRVTAGFVALERDGRESIVPAGATCLTKKGKGLGTPFSEDASVNFQNALFKFDFENSGSEAVKTIVKEANVYDAITLWHLLSRTRAAEREKVFDALHSFVKLPKGANREGVLKLDKKMLDDWWREIETVWFG